MIFGTGADPHLADWLRMRSSRSLSFSCGAISSHTLSMFSFSYLRPSFSSIDFCVARRRRVVLYIHEDETSSYVTQDVQGQKRRTVYRRAAQRQTSFYHPRICTYLSADCGRLRLRKEEASREHVKREKCWKCFYVLVSPVWNCSRSAILKSGVRSSGAAIHEYLSEDCIDFWKPNCLTCRMCVLALC